MSFPLSNRIGTLMLLSATLTQSFVLVPSSSTSNPSIAALNVNANANVNVNANVNTRLAAGDDIDDWYAGFDPASFDTKDNDSYAFSRGSSTPDRDGDRRRGGGGRGGGDRYGGRGGGRGGGGGGRYGGGGGGRGGGGGGRSQEYTRDLGADQSQVDEAAVSSMISQRLQFRKTGRFQEADALRDDLLSSHGVLVRDSDSKWRTGASESGSGQQWLRDGRSNDRDGGDRFGNRGGRGGDRNGDRGGRRPRQTRDFGPNGHDYDQSRDAGPNTSSLSEPEIHDLIATRLRFKMSRSFREADDIQEQLFNAGVNVHDGRKEWRSDGVGFGESTDEFGRPGSENRDYAISSASPPTDDAEAIQALVEERAEARLVRNYALADDIQDELRGKYKVEVHDKLREWSIGGKYSNGADSKPDPTRPYEFRGTNPLSIEDATIVEGLLEQRDNMKALRKFNKADQIRDQLKNQFKVGMDDRTRQYYVAIGEYQPSEYSIDLDEETATYVQAQMDKRSIAKLTLDYEGADAIRDELRDDYLIEISDRDKSWTALPAEDEEYGAADDDEEDEVVSAVEVEEVAEEEEEAVEEEAKAAEDEETTSGTVAAEEVDYSTMTVPELKELLREKGLKVGGKKSELIERLEL